MKLVQIAITLSATLLAGQLAAQPQQTASPYQVINCIKLNRGVTGFVEFVRESSMKVAEARVRDGEILSWGLLRGILPAGEEARCDYLTVTFSEGPPAEGPLLTQERLDKAGVKMTLADLLARRNQLSYLVSTEYFRRRLAVGTPQKGNYLYLNLMKVYDMPGFARFENDIWRPLAEHWVKEGSQSGWGFSTLMMPAGTEVKYAAMTVDMFPTWKAAFAPRPIAAAFKQVHPDKDLEKTFEPQGKLRDLARRELYQIVERAAK